MTILLDIDGVMVTTPSWQRPELEEDGFMKFNERARDNLALLIAATGAHMVLTTTHRVNFDIETWKHLFHARGLYVTSLSKINAQTIFNPKENRAEEILKWIDSPGADKNYVIIDDDPSIHALPATIKERWVRTSSLIGFDEASRLKAISILQNGI